MGRSLQVAMPRYALPLLLALLPFLAGCVAVAAAGVVGVGVFQYQRNEQEQDFRSELAETWEAVLDGLERLEIEPEVRELSTTEGRIEHADLRVLIERYPEGFTRVRVRVGAFHSRDHDRRARIVLKEIASSLEQQDDLRAWAEETVEE